MLRFVVRRLVGMVFVLFAVSVLTFLVFNVIPNSDPAVRMAGRQANESTIEAIRREWGFDEPLHVQYLTTMEKVLTGDLVSQFTQLNVMDEIAKGLPRTFSLAIGAAIMWMLFALALGLYSALKAGKVADRLLTILALIGISMPVFWVGALMNHYLGFKAGLFPNGGYVPLTEDPVQWAYHLILPWTALSLLFIGFYSRVLRSNVLDTINEDFVRTARAKGLSERRVLLKHVLRNSLIPIVTLMASLLPALIGGSVIIEFIFTINGMGKLSIDAILSRDYNMVMAFTTLSAVLVLLGMLLSDILYTVVDPRISLEG